MKFKRFLALALSLLMVFGGAASIFAADDDATTEAEEVTAANPYQAAIDALKVLGIFKGDDNGDSADKAVNRWQMALFVSRALTGEIDDAYWGKTAYDYSKFTDVTGTSSLYLGAIGFANQKGIILGYDDPKTGKPIFNPDGGITYQDALTMATRTLGFTGLAYPWGVIEKAIDLELTKGIVDVGYQDELTRGEVAQIVYNMLIAKVLGADGKYWTLKDKAFGIQEAVVVIVAADQVRYDIDNELLKRDNYVSFQILGEDGKVTDPVYSMKASDFGIDSDEDLNSYVGYSYSVATSNDFASFVSCEMNETVTYWNLGKTTKGTEFTATTFNKDKVNEYTKLVVVNPDDAKDTTDNYSIVEDYTTLRTIQGAKTGVEKIPGDSEILVYDPSVESTIVTDEGSGYYTDGYGNILKVSTDTWDSTLGKYITKLTVKYYYNSVTKSYYEATTNTYYNTVTGEWIYGYVPVSDEDVAKLKVGYATTGKWSFGQITGLGSVSSTYAYASLTLIDDYRAYEGYDRAIYKAYGLGKVVTSDKDDDGNLRTKIQTPTGVVSEKVTVLNRKTSATAFSEAPPTFVDAVTGKKLDTPKDGAWILYYYNAMTNTVEVLETLTVEKGTLTGWSIDKKTVTIGNENFPANYDTLKNNGIGYTARTANGTIYTDDSIKVENNKRIYNLYTRGINYIVLDGEVVWIEANNANGSSGVVVLHSFLGMTADGSLEFYAYTTKDPGALRKIVVGSVDNYYYGYYSTTNNVYTNSYFNNLFSDVMGREYRIAAIADTGVYYLTTPNYSTNTLTFDTYYRGVFNTKLPDDLNGDTDKAIQVSITSDTYFVFTNGNQIITAKGNPALDVLKYTYADTETSTATIWNAIIGNFYWATSKMIVVEIDNETLWTTLKTAFDTTSSIKYYYAKSGINYPAGTTSNTALGTAGITFSGLVNIVTGKNADDITTTNVNITAGNVYKVVDGVVTEIVTGTGTTIWNTVTGTYTSAIAHNTNYVYGGTITFNYTPSGEKDIATRYDNIRKAILGEVSITTDNKMTSAIYNLIQNKNNVVVRTLDKTGSSKIVISDKYADPDNKGNIVDLVTTSTTPKTYTVEYFYNSKTGEVAAYISAKDYVASTAYAVTIASSANTWSTKATIVPSKSGLTWTYTDTKDAIDVTSASISGGTIFVKDTLGNYVPLTTVDYSGSTIEVSTGGLTATITFRNSADLAVTLPAGNYAIKDLAISEGNYTHSVATLIEFTVK